MRWCDCATRRRPSPSTAARSPNAPGCGKLFAPVVSNYKRYVDRSIAFQRLELVDGPGHRAAALRAAVSAVLQRRDHAGRPDPVRIGLRPDPGRAVVLPQRLRHLRRLPGRDHPARRPGHRQRRGQGAAGDHDHALCRRHGPARRHRGPHARRQATDQPARHAPGGRGHIGGHRPVGQREDHAVAQPGRVVAVHVRHADAAVRAERDDVPVAAALRAPGRPARRRDLSDAKRARSTTKR